MNQGRPAEKVVLNSVHQGIRTEQIHRRTAAVVSSVVGIACARLAYRATPQECVVRSRFNQFILQALITSPLSLESDRRDLSAVRAPKCGRMKKVHD